MKKQEMKNLLFEMLGAAVSGTEFRLKRSDDAFLRKIPGGRQMLGLPLWDYNPEFEFSLNIGIRLDAVEDIFHRFSGSPSAKYQAMSYTTLTPLERFTDGQSKYTVLTAEDVARAGNLLFSVIRGKIIPFFDMHVDAMALDRSVNCDQPGIDMTQYPSRAMHAVILARLAANKDFDKIATRHRTDMELAPDADHSFNRLVGYLMTH